LNVQATGEKPLKVADVLSLDTITVQGKEYLLWLDGDILSVHQKNGDYAGVRFLLDDASKPLFIVKDYSNGSTYLDTVSRQVVLEWVTDGKFGYFQRTDS